MNGPGAPPGPWLLINAATDSSQTAELARANLKGILRPASATKR
jgi:hypothetical protein